MSGSRPTPRVAVRLDPCGVRSVHIDGAEIPHVNAVSVEGQVGEVTRVHLTLLGVLVEFTGEAEVKERYRLEDPA